MAVAALAVEFVFGALHLIPQDHHVGIVEGAISWNYTTWLNLGFLDLSASLVVRFLRTGGPEMLRMMSTGDHSHHPNVPHAQDSHEHH